MPIYRLLPASLLILVAIFAFRPSNQNTFDDGFIRFQPIRLDQKDRATLTEALKEYHPKYDEKGKMLINTLTGYNYHTDATVGDFHDVRRSLLYSLALLDLGDKAYEQRAFQTIATTIALQDQNPNSKTAGIWPYYREEPLATKKSPPDFNWADFNGESLLDVWMGHQKKIPDSLKPKIRESLILAAKSIQKRNMGPGYTNIAIKGTYVTYLVSHLFDLQDMQAYARKRLHTFYNYTLEKGFTEYNSPTYTIEALDDLTRMQRHIVQREDKQMIDSIYNLGWAMIARHYHQPTAQWAGPHSRSYASMLRAQVNTILRQASNDRIKTGASTYRLDVKVRHKIPAYLEHYFLSPNYPRTEIDTFIRDQPPTIGTCHLTQDFALSTANRSSMWNQRRPFLAYWGTVEQPHYLQVRFLFDNYDLSSAAFYSEQKQNKVLAGINFMTNGGGKHISIDRLVNGKLHAKDLRLRFEFGNMADASALKIPAQPNEKFDLNLDGITIGLQLFYSAFGDLKGHWEKGSDGKIAWLDYIIYSGDERDFDLLNTDKAAMGFSFLIDKKSATENFPKPEFAEQDSTLSASWAGMSFKISSKPQTLKHTTF